MATQHTLNGSVDALGALLGEGGAGAGYFSNISYEDHGQGLKEIVCQSDSLYFRLGGMTDYGVYSWCVAIHYARMCVRKAFQSKPQEDES